MDICWERAGLLGSACAVLLYAVLLSYFLGSFLLRCLGKEVDSTVSVPDHCLLIYVIVSDYLPVPYGQSCAKHNL